MDKKITLQNLSAVINRCGITPLVLLFSFLLFGLQAKAQTLKTDSSVPVLDVCNDYQQFIVRIASGNQPCQSGALKIELPNGFELEAGSVNVGGTPATVISQTGQEVTVAVSILAGPASQELEVTFRAKALCGIISVSGDPSVTYTLSGCAGGTQTGTSEAVNIRYAILRVSVAPDPIVGNIGDQPERTITIKNQGNGEISQFTLDRTLGGGLSHVSYDYSALTAAGWTVDDSNPNQIVFTGVGVSLKSGESITLKEKVQIDNCALTATNYEVYYGCATKCTASGVNGKATHIINLVAANAPRLSVTKSVLSPVLNCFNDYGTNTWTVKNDGTVATDVITFQISAQVGIDVSSIKLDGVPVTVVSSTATTAIIQIPALAAGASTTLSFNQYYEAPNGSAANCASAPTQFSNGQNAFSATYGYQNACAPVMSAGTVSGETSYNYAGMHVGEVDIIGGTAFQADHLFTNFNIPSNDLNPGDQFVITVELSPELATLAFNFAGVNAVNVGSNKYELTFTYGTAPWATGDLNFSFNRLLFDIMLDCSSSPDLDNLWYRVGGELRKMNGGASCDPVVFKCTETKLKGFCPTGPCANGLENGPAGVNRLSLGHAANGTGVPAVGTPSTNADVRTFITGDILEIYQTSTAHVTNGPFNKVRLVVEKDPTANATLRSNSGKVIVNGTTITSNAVVTETSSTYVLEYTFSTALADADQVRLSIELKAGASTTGLKQFPAKSYLIDNTGQGLLCGRTYTATGFYVTYGFDFTGGTKSFVDCEENTNTATFSANILGFKTQDVVFNNEYRKMFVFTNAVLQVPNGITMTGVKVTVKNQPWITTPTTSINGLNVNNASYTLDLSTALKTITEGALGAGNGIDYLDEGFELEITPIAVIAQCEPATSATSKIIGVAINGNILDGEGLTTPYSNTKNLTYNTGIGTLNLATSNNSELGRLSPDGTEVSWVVKVESTASRNFNSVWLAKSDATLNNELIITSVEQVTSYEDTTVLNALTDNGNNIYQLGDFTSGEAKYYLIKANVIDCLVKSLTVRVGYSCTSGDYPASVNDGCRIEDKVLTHKQIENILQTEIFDQFNGVSTKPDLCDEIWYSVQLHNGGDAQLDNLKITIPLNTAPGLAYNNKFEYSNVYQALGGSATAWTLGNAADAEVDVLTNTLVITLPASIELNSVERIRVKVYFKADSCDFKSGAKHTVTPSALNTCGTPVAAANITSATTKRLIISGGSDAFPELREEGITSVDLDPVLTTGGVLRAVYNAEIRNSGEFGVNDAVTNQYQVALQLPADWSIVGDPAAYLLPAGKVQYIGIDPVRGYLYQVTSNINVGETLKFANVPLKYTGTDITTLTCSYNFGDIKLTVFQNIPVADCLPSPACSGSGIDQVLYENILPMELPVDTLLTIEPEYQYPEICNPSINGSTPTLADIPFEGTTTVYHLDWYENELEAIADNPADRLPYTTPLVDGRTYYVINRFIADGVCTSNIGKITVTFKDNNLQGTVTTLCSPDNQTYRVQVTLAGEAPFSVDPASTGFPGTFSGNVWTSEPLAATTPYGAGTSYDVTFTDANNCTPLNLTGIAPMCCTLEITCPAEITIACGTSIDPSVTGMPVIVNSCGNTSFTYTDSPMTSCTNGVKTLTRTFTVTDQQGNTETCTQIINITDLVKPVFNEALPENLTVSCASLVPAAAQMTATDNCGNAVVTFTQDTLPGDCANNFTINRTWTATDGCGNTTVHTQTITVNDDVAPTFVGALPAAALTVSCSADIPAAATLTATDNCGTATVNLVETTTPGTCANNYTLTRVWTATDACGNTATHTQVITVDDQTAPFITTNPQDLTVQCDGIGNSAMLNTWLANQGGAIATDNCGAVTWTHNYDVANFVATCGNAGSIEVTFTATDACGNATTATATFTITDATAPTFNETLPAAEVVATCDNIPAAAVLTASDNCGIATVTFTEKTVNGLCANSYDLVRVWTATDECGNTTTHTQTVKVSDTTKPVFVEALPANATYSCSADVPAAATLTATDNCGTATVTFNETRVDGSCANSYVLTRTWTATDECGNATTHTQTITVSDTTKPVFVEALPANATYSCSADVPAAATLTATDNCGTATVTFNETRVDGSCANSYVLTRTWTATDECGNATTHTQTITVADTTAPVFTVDPQNKIVECDGAGNLTGADGFHAWLADNAGAIATDNCGNVEITYLIEDTNTICGGSGTIIVDFIATDDCGNFTIKQATYAIVDTTPPVVTDATDLVIECSINGEDELNAWLSNHGGATATDTCGLITWTHDYTGSLTICGNPITVTFTATDSCGNRSTTQATVSVVDTIVPILTKQAQSLTVQCGANTTQALNNWLANHAGAEATDSCSTVTWTNNYDAANFVAACGATGSVEVIFTASDACGNVVTTTATFTIEDTVSPTLVKTAQNQTVECDGSGNLTELNAWLANNGGATVTDTCDANVTWTNDYDAANFAALCGATGSVTVTFTATDACGNSVSTIATFTIADTTKPVFTIDPQNEIVECDGLGNLTAFNAWLANNGGATATDNCGTVTWSHRIEDTNTICGGSGSIVVDFTATDECGNRTTKQAVFLIRDTTAPSIDTPATDLTIECGASELDALNAWLNNNGGATSSDVCGFVTWTHNYNGLTTAACGSTGSALVTFTATDSCGNVSTTQATVSVVDTTLPILTKAAQDLTVQCGANTTQALNNWLANHAGAEATDSCSTVTWTNNYDAANFVAACGATGSVEVIFTASDACGNVLTTTATFTIEDTTAPTLVTPAQPQTVECDGTGNTAALNAWLANNGGATATDTCDANLMWTNDYDAANFAALCGATGSVTVTFTATDACGNSVSTVSTFTIVDTTNPIFTTEPQNEVVECDGTGNTAAYNAWLAAYGNSVATDICGTVTYTYSVIDTAVLCGNTSRTTVQFTATDACGNNVSKQATFTIEDTTAPVITTEAIALTIECGNDASNQINTWLNNRGGAIATDVCGTVTWTHNYNGLTTTACGNTGSALVTFTATDSCGNVSTTQATVSVVDTTLPILTKAAQDLTVQCGANTTQALNNWLANHAGAEATDSCSTVTWTNNYDEANFVAACGATGSVEVIFTASDACGNVVTTTATFTIEDTTAPTLVTPAQPQTVECDGTGNTTALNAWLANNGGATATDTCDANLTWTNDYDAANFAALCGATGSVTVTFTATDACGNSVSTIATFTIVDTTNPIFTTEPQNEVVECDGSGNTAAYNAWLAAYGNSVATDNCGTVTYTYSVIDTAVLCGNTSRTTVQFTATDACGNQVSKQATFTIEDTTAPDFITEAEDLVVECDGTGNNSDLSAWLNNRAGATAEDACSNSLTWTHNFSGLTKGCGMTGTAEVTFTVTDACGNSSQTTATFTIVDTTAPVFNVNLPQDRTIECSDDIPEVTVLTADDLCSKVTVTFREERVDGNCPNNYELVRTWTAEDACGNTTEHTQIITVQDTTAPEFVGPLPAEEIFIRCEDLKDAETIKAIDNCGAAVVTVSDELIPGACDTKYQILRTWLATDECGNETSFTQTIHLSCQIEVFNTVTPNGDGYNDELVLNGIECYPGNTVEIFNRWGVLVYETKDYNSRGNTFKGISEGRVTVNKDPKLPTGTYYYVIKYNYDIGNGNVYPIEQAGYLHLETNK